MLCASFPLEVYSYIFGVAHAKIVQKSRFMKRIGDVGKIPETANEIL
ncbi:MAG: hypothetical protein J5921_05355 [Clostridia bacterium]|nr:hypothetical protein [Clostridia bacterium]